MEEKKKKSYLEIWAENEIRRRSAAMRWKRHMIMVFFATNVH